MSHIQTQTSHDRHVVGDSTVFNQIEENFTFDLFVENFFMKEDSWILKEVCPEKTSPIPLRAHGNTDKKQASNI